MSLLVLMLCLFFPIMGCETGASLGPGSSSSSTSIPSSAADKAKREAENDRRQEEEREAEEAELLEEAEIKKLAEKKKKVQGKTKKAKTKADKAGAKTATQTVTGIANGFTERDFGGGGDCFFLVVNAALNLKNGTDYSQQDVRNQIAEYLRGLSPADQKTITTQIAEYHTFQSITGEVDLLTFYSGPFTTPNGCLPKNPTDVEQVKSVQDLANLVAGTGNARCAVDGPYRGDDFIFPIVQRALGVQLILVNDKAQIACIDNPEVFAFGIPLELKSKGHYVAYSFVFENQQHLYFSQADIANYPQPLKDFLALFAATCKKPWWKP